MRPYQQKIRQRKIFTKKRLIIVAVFLIVAGGVLAVLELTNKTFLFHKDPSLRSAPNKPNRSLNSNTKGENGSSSNSQNKSTSSSNGSSTNDATHESKDKNDSPAGSSEPLKQPSGTFVSNHRPNLSGKPAPNTMQSTCETTSGATCQIIFTKGSEVKSLPVQTTDRGGAAYWSWKLQDIGLSQGTWKVQAKAVLGSQTQTADDATNLEVGP